jgi:hypothetical protein
VYLLGWREFACSQMLPVGLWRLGDAQACLIGVHHSLGRLFSVACLH